MKKRKQAFLKYLNIQVQEVYVCLNINKKERNLKKANP